MYKQYLKTKKNTNSDTVLSVHISHVDVAITPKAEEQAPDREATGVCSLRGLLKHSQLKYKTPEERYKKEIEKEARKLSHNRHPLPVPVPPIV